MFTDTNTAMYFGAIFSIIVLVGLITIKLLNQNATQLRKSWNIYIVMLSISAIFCMGLLFCLPNTMSSIKYDYNNEITKIETIQDAKSILIEQRREINELKDSTQTFRNILWVFFSIGAMFFPTIYYNQIKSNLDIEKLSGKRMGSFD